MIYFSFISFSISRIGQTLILVLLRVLILLPFHLSNLLKLLLILKAILLQDLVTGMNRELYYFKVSSYDFQNYYHYSIDILHLNIYPFFLYYGTTIDKQHYQQFSTNYGIISGSVSIPLLDLNVLTYFFCHPNLSHPLPIFGSNLIIDPFM